MERGKPRLSEAIRKLLGTLNPLEARILRLSFGLEGKHSEYNAEIAESLGIPTEFVKEYRIRALRKLRHPSRARVLHDYFLEQKAVPQTHVEIVVPRAIEEVDKLTPQLLDRLRSKANDIEKLKASHGDVVEN